MKNKIFFAVIFILGVFSFADLAMMYMVKQSSFLSTSMAKFEADLESNDREEEAKERFFQQTREADKKVMQK